MSDIAIHDTIIEFFTEDDWPYTALEDQPVFQTAFQGSNGQWACFAQARESQEQFVFYSICPVNVPPERHPAMAEFLTRANYGLPVGNFEMDFDDGEIRYKTSLDVEGDRISTALIKQAVRANVIMMDQYLPGILAIISGGGSPEEIIKGIES